MAFEKEALIIVDMQNDFIHDEGLVRKSSQKIGVPTSSLDLLRTPIPAIKQLADFFRTNRRKVIHIYTAWESDYSDVAIPLKKMIGRGQKRGALVSDATATFDLEGHQATLKVIATGFGEVMTTKEVLTLLKS
jgi:nicotinamidase-related amidase